jgi:hypothetical protein
VPSLNLQPNPRGGTVKKMSSPYKNILRQLRKRKSSRPLNPKPIGFRRMLFLVLQKDGREKCLPRSNTPSDSDIDLVVLFTDDSAEEKKNKTLIVCTVLVVSLKTTMEKSGYDMRDISDGRTHFVLVWRKILFLSFVREKLFCS